MASTSNSQAKPEPVSNDWSELVPKGVDHVKIMSAVKRDDKWEKLYAAAGLRNPSERTRKACRLGVYVYCYNNGTSREGEYSGNITLADGHIFDAAVIVKVVGRMDVRRFMRSNADEAYVALKTSLVIEKDSIAGAKAANHSVRPEHAFALADFFDMCPLLTPAEKAAHDSVFAYRLKKSERSRGSRTLEEVEESRLDEQLSAQERSGGSAVNNVF